MTHDIKRIKCPHCKSTVTIEVDTNDSGMGTVKEHANLAAFLREKGPGGDDISQCRLSGARVVLGAESATFL